MFLKRTENGWSCVRCASSLTGLSLHRRAIMYQVTSRGKYLTQHFDWPGLSHQISA